MQLTAPQALPATGTKYANSPYSTRGSWTIPIPTSRGKLFLMFGIANLTYPRTALSTTYSLIISKQNETVSTSYVTSFTARVTNLKIEDNYDGSWSNWGKTRLPDALQATGLVFFQTSGDHQLKFTVTYEIYNLFPIGYAADHSETRSFNITQTLL